jgi:hypothetical protein
MRIFIPQFDILPFGGFWYTNNQVNLPEDYLFLEVITVIENNFNVTTDPKQRTLMG